MTNDPQRSLSPGREAWTFTRLRNLETSQGSEANLDREDNKVLESSRREEFLIPLLEEQ